jgi:hypothetical protein
MLAVVFRSSRLADAVQPEEHVNMHRGDKNPPRVVHR